MKFWVNFDCLSSATSSLCEAFVKIYRKYWQSVILHFCQQLTVLNGQAVLAEVGRDVVCVGVVLLGFLKHLRACIKCVDVCVAIFFHLLAQQPVNITVVFAQGIYQSQIKNFALLPPHSNASKTSLTSLPPRPVPDAASRMRACLFSPSVFITSSQPSRGIL